MSSIQMNSAAPGGSIELLQLMIRVLEKFIRQQTSSKSFDTSNTYTPLEHNE
ncbi:hypothetical protein RI543_000611 [Arxiozyma heterogenica]|uniref:Uncharacterized protein n=1 Tax=Arxiozyma heterogenica TaxID=278026 RepID=A0AAN7WJA9_9SACH|nr:hypothetical protein RI543_000611 [Kazachstania heterogenica]